MGIRNEKIFEKKLKNQMERILVFQLNEMMIFVDEIHDFRWSTLPL